MQITPILPTVAELVAIAIAQTDFAAEIRADADDIRNFADIAIEQAAEIWECDNGCTLLQMVPSQLTSLAREALIDAGLDLLGLAAAAAEDALRDAIESGDLDADGEPIAYPTYRAV